MRAPRNQVQSSHSMHQEPRILGLLALTLTSILLGTALVPSILPVKFEANARGSNKWKEKSLTTDQIKLYEINPTLNVYHGNPELQRLVEEKKALPLSLASGDFDEDGTLDVIGGYSYADRLGFLVLHEGNKVSVPAVGDEMRYVNDVSFLLQARTIELGSTPDFLTSGDFNHDGHLDVAAAARGKNKINILLGNGRGNLVQADPITLPGTLTTLAGDGLCDLAAGIEEEGRATLLWFHGIKGLSRPEVFTLPALANTLLVSQLDDDNLMDVAIGAGQELTIINGRYQEPTADEILHGSVQPPIAVYHSSSKLISLAAGRFTNSSRREIAFLTEEGDIFLANGRKTQSNELQDRRWDIRIVDAGRNPNRSQLLTGRVLGGANENLLVVDRVNGQVNIIKVEPRKEADGSVSDSIPVLRIDDTVTLNCDSEPIAMLPMKLNDDTLSDLFILGREQKSPTLVITAPVATINVNSAADTNARDTVITLREAILIANGTLPKGQLSAAEQTLVSGNPTGTSFDAIQFTFDPGLSIDVGSSGLGALPTIRDQVFVEGLFPGTQFIVQLNGTDAGAGANGLVIAADNSTIRNVAIRSFKGSGMVVSSRTAGDSTGTSRQSDAFAAPAGNNEVKSNLIGRVPLFGLVGAGNGTGITVLSSNNIIGAPTPPNALSQFNIISGNVGNGIVVDSDAVANVIQSNFIGTDTTGTADLGNGQSGIFVNGSGNIIGARLNPNGTPAADGGNIIAFNKAEGITATADTRNLFLLNRIYSNIGVALEVFPLGPNPDTPRLESAVYFPGLMKVTGTLNSFQDRTWKLLFYQCDGTENRRGLSLDSTGLTLTTAANVSKPFSYDYTQDVTGGSVTCQAIDPVTPYSTEYALCLPICAYSVSSSSTSFPSTGGSGTVKVTVPTGCDWTATAKSTGDWIRLTSAASNNGSKDISFTVAANPNAGPRSGMITITSKGQGQDLVIQQGEASPMITSVTTNRKQLILTGKGFEIGASIFVDGVRQKQAKTINDPDTPTTKLINLKAARWIAPGMTVTIRVENPSGGISPDFRWTRPIEAPVSVGSTADRGSP